MTATKRPRLILAHPLSLPMKLRLPRGLFGAHRDTMKRPHEGIDLLAPKGKPVFAVAKGTVLETGTLDGPENQKVAIDHNDEGSALISRYLHIKIKKVIKPGKVVNVADKIGTVGPAPPDSNKPHLHLELRLMLNRSDPTPTGNRLLRRSLPLDPTRCMYRWEDEYYGFPDTESPAKLKEFSIMPRSGVRMVQVFWKQKWYYLPLYQPTRAELELVDLLRQAFLREIEVRLAPRKSVFFGNRKIITAARVVKP